VVKLAKPTPKEKFLDKHPPLTDDEVKAKFKEASIAKETFTKDMTEIEKNLLGYVDITEPLIDPETGKLLAWMKIPSNVLLEEFWIKYSVSQKQYADMTPEEKVEQISRQYELMAKLLVPDHTAEWWKQHTNPRFSKLFALKLEQLFEEMGVTTENFPEAT